MKKILVFAFAFLFCRAYECVYPVALDEAVNSVVVYVLYQKDTSLELLRWNAETKLVHKVLSARFFPSQVSLIPNNYGFSFIDQGVIWVKSYAKRSPTYLEIPIPLRHIDYICWKDSVSCYFSALQGDCYALFELDRYGNISCLLSMDACDFLYPQKVGTSLFCIVRMHKNNKYYLIKSSYPSSQISSQSILHYDTDCKPICSFDTPVAFLNMVSDDKAFIISIQREVCPEKKVQSYTYGVLRLIHSDVWSLESLFSFSLPHVSTRKTFELVLPFLPRYNKEYEKIVYTSFEEYFTVYEYDLVTEISKQLSKEGADSFAPCFFQDKIMWGGELKHDEVATQGPRMWVAEEHVCLDLPCYDCLR